jgi:hypothetical protein
VRICSQLLHIHPKLLAKNCRTSASPSGFFMSNQLMILIMGKFAEMLGPSLVADVAYTWNGRGESRHCENVVNQQCCGICGVLNGCC